MIVCVCNNVNEKTVAKCVVEHSCSTTADLQQHIAICDQCALCKSAIERIISNDGEIYTLRKNQELRKAPMQIGSDIIFRSSRC